jgi:HK97 family phage portal protein
MPIIDTIANRFGFQRATALVDGSPYRLYAPVDRAPAKTEPPANPEPWMLRTAAGEQWSMPDMSAADAQTQLYARLSWVQIAVSRTAEFAATVPFSVKRREGERLVDIPNHPFEALIMRPNPLQSRAELLVGLLSYLLLNGNAFAWLNRKSRDAAPDELWIIPTRQINPVPDGRLFLRGYTYDPLDGGALVPLEPWEVMHLKRYNPHSWFWGLSPLEALAQVAHGDLAQQKWNTNLFAKDNAKLPGALTFADNIPDPIWKKMQEELRQNHGGTARNLLMLRATGPGGVNWVPMAMSHGDMEFLQGRQFTKEEIFSLYAPGLSSILAVNATEANSKAGKDTFRELAIWPLLTALAEKITNDILPAYGPGLVGVFDDVRMKDRALELAEQDAFARVHTIDEVREKFYEANPIGDERGQLLVVQVNATSGGIQEPPPSPFGGENAPPGADDKEQPDARAVEDAQDDEEDAPEREEAAARERKAFKRWVKRHPDRDPGDFAFKVLGLPEQEALLGEMRGGFRVDWHAYP